MDVQKISNNILGWFNAAKPLIDPWDRENGCHFTPNLGDSRENGIYMFVARHTKFVYPMGESSIYYIGSGKPLINRLKGKLKKDLDDERPGYNERITIDNETIYHYPTSTFYNSHETDIYYLFIPNALELSEKDVENAIIAAFHLKFGIKPMGNRAPLKARIWANPANTEALKKIQENILNY
jgi:hypothetical protein